MSSSRHDELMMTPQLGARAPNLKCFRLRVDGIMSEMKSRSLWTSLDEPGRAASWEVGDSEDQAHF